MNAYVVDWRRVTPAVGLLLGKLENPRYTPDRRDTRIQTGHKAISFSHMSKLRHQS